MSYLQDKIFKLKGKIQHYAWGGKNFIPSWLGIEPKNQKPYAEYWMGAHASAPATLCTRNGELSLHQLIKDYPEEILGKKVQQQFGELPYLLKILDVKDMLSIQVHPTRKGAEEGFLAEQAAGILPTASYRNYKDKNHKPEMMIALSEFWLLHGFLPKEKLQKRLENIAEFISLKEVYLKKGIKGLFHFVMNMPQQEVNEILLPLIKKELERKKKKQLTKDDPGWWVAKLWNLKKDEDQDIDRGIFSIYFFNIVHLSAGDAIFQGAGIPHAYLEGQNVELMANSDNVLRGGLTDKHVDVPELMKHIRFEGITPEIIKGKNINVNEVDFPCPVPDFGIHKIMLQPGNSIKAKSDSFEVLTVMEGSLAVKNTKSLQANKGETIAILPGVDYEISASENTVAFKAFVP